MSRDLPRPKRRSCTTRRIRLERRHRSGAIVTAAQVCELHNAVEVLVTILGTAHFNIKVVPSRRQTGFRDFGGLLCRKFEDREYVAFRPW